MVGLQVWRGALLLADFLLHSALPGAETGLCVSKSDHIVELGAGTGLSSVAAAMVTGRVTSTGKHVLHKIGMKPLTFITINLTDISKGSILSLIETNVRLNSNLTKGDVKVCELDFYNSNYSPDLVAEIEKANIIIAADGTVVYFFFMCSH